MLYETFLQTVTQQMQQRLGSHYQLEIRSVPKNNGLVMDGLSFFTGGSRVSPTIYLNPFYQKYRSGIPMEQILAEITGLYARSGLPLAFDPAQLEQPSFVRPRIAYKLIHAASNTRLLSQIPCRLMMDLAKVYYLYLGENEGSQMTIPISRQHLRLWNMDESELDRLAEVNTPRLFPAQICSILDLLSLSENLIHPGENPIPFYVLTNQAGLGGAACMLYDGILKDFADQMESDLLILPSSIHEVLLLSFKDDDQIGQLCQMVSDINSLEVPEDERLSNQVYQYSRATERLSLASRSAAPLT